MPYRRDGSTKWWITVAGVRQSSRTADYDAAKALEAKLNHEAWKREHMDIEPAHSWKESVVKYLQEHRHAASYSTIVQRLRWWDAHLGKVEDIRKITRDVVDKAMHKHRTITALPSPGNTTANKYVIVVGAVLNAACREWGWTQSSPKLRRYPEPEHRREYLQLDEWRRLETELPAHLKPPARFALATGLRKSKVFGLTWDQIDKRNRSLTTTGNATKRGNTIPLNKTALAVLEEISASPVRHLKRVFTYKGAPLADYGDAFYKARERAGLPDFTWHGLRHTFASWLGQSGASETVIDQLGGWAEKDTRSIYTHLGVESLRPYSEVIDRVLDHSATQSGISISA